ncbi:MAG: pseudaminic acid synthase [Gammaproteobacteria bacterium]|nr:pseudaminic acid synthase [Gammaproteobacteria bacterium]NIO61278.1 pseudaminic acid synthase [Gammaproteobacteria bacterium]
MNKTVTIDHTVIGSGCPPYIVAELSANHLGDIDRARKIIRAAKSAGANAIKLQTYTADTLTIDYDGPGFKIEGGLWQGRTLHDLYEEACTPWEWHEELFNLGKKIGITMFSSPFDDSAVSFLETLDCPAYKIASFEILDLELVSSAARTGKPLIISTGLANEDEIADAINTAGEAGCKELVLLHCISSYPTPPEDCHLLTMTDLGDKHNLPVGLSDHTPGIAAALAAVGLGACMIEKHVTLKRDEGGPDAPFSLEPDELEMLTQQSRTAWQALGEINYGIKPSETGNEIFRRSLYVVRDIKEGEAFTRENIRCIRPGFGLAPKYLKEILGCKAVASIQRGTPLNWNHVSGVQDKEKSTL